jgi:hypothetical protein
MAAVFQITINGRPYCEAADIGAVTLVVESVPRRGGDRVSIHARSAVDDTVQWLGAHLGVGDEVHIRIVEAVENIDAGPEGCSFCGRDIHELKKLVTGRKLGICDGCIAAFASSLKSGTPLPVGASLRDEPEWTCSHCSRRPPEIAGVVVRNGAAICAECLRASSDILENHPDI